MNRRDLAAIGFMTFALFLGAGNLIYPPLMAQQAGENWLVAIVGFLLTAVGLPAFTLVVLGRLSSADKLTALLPKWMDRSFWFLVLTTLGPAFVLPRAVTVAYEMGVKPFYSGNGLMVFSALFCALTLWLALKPGKLVDYIGKVMTPALIAMLAVLVIAALVNPLGEPSQAIEVYQQAPTVNGLIQGYMTLDAIAAVAFGWVIIQTIRSKGIEDKKAISYYTIRIAVIYSVLMSLCYLAMGYLGSTSSEIAPSATNGGEILTRYAAGEFGMLGQILLAAITLMACLTTTIGLTNANSEYYKNTYGVTFKVSATVIMVLTAIISNFGLETIIEVSLPAILILCPIAISLIIAMVLISEKSESNTPTISMSHTVVVCIAALFGTIDALHILGKLPEGITAFCEQWLPLFSSHTSWLLPVFITIFVHKLFNKTMIKNVAVNN
ncbi:branched-chain amino acid transport system II carrier protein [Aliivibrio fischeri]|uniref:branched-chain amino acid transport system II carrier protein n=1 Tax=Aliivibrio fischeri TaxID=668 RepID=UPI00130FC356|nr:branched-chain amino acid transport system II carrier protein [Aliivibrio fischeri]MUK70730.1 branched-chain amino acid transport system II carrier protein [Aliivibrio fischeri]MUK74992.1 branched-chain amino acid transport system II carrier protein [Aliivibrio fischeri]MUK75622.1 branched-chain amino acid transport system II carrier protein [Aliivibrio fischeri]MUL21706.1 branched-chain amino acid transport system II carrier protein [Aliivibrio fischeri]